MQLVLLEGFGTALTGTSRKLDFLNSCSDGSDGFSGSDFSTGLDGFSGFSGLVLVLLSDWIGLVFLDFRTCSGSSFGLDRFGFSGSGFRLVFQGFGSVGISGSGLVTKMKLTDIGHSAFGGYWIQRTFWFRDIGFDCFVSINFYIKINLYTYPQQ